MNSKLDSSFLESLKKLPEQRSQIECDIIYENLKQLETLSTFRDSTIKCISKFIKYKTYEKDAFLFKSGDLITSWYVVLNGSILLGSERIDKKSKFGRKMHFQNHRTIDCKTLESCEILIIDYHDDDVSKSNIKSDLEKSAEIQLKDVPDIDRKNSSINQVNNDAILDFTNGIDSPEIVISLKILDTDNEESNLENEKTNAENVSNESPIKNFKTDHDTQESEVIKEYQSQSDHHNSPLSSLHHENENSPKNSEHEKSEIIGQDNFVNNSMDETVFEQNSSNSPGSIEIIELSDEEKNIPKEMESSKINICTKNENKNLVNQISIDKDDTIVLDDSN
ncbi:unnamed protein product, partial [Brachionus calyciflorus]